MAKSIAALGVFDGVHLGHRYLLDTLQDECRAKQLLPKAFTFNPCPHQFFRPDSFRGLIIPFETRRQLIEDMGIELIALPFDADLQKLTAAEFLRILRADYGVERLLLGYDQRFGSDALPTTEAYAETARAEGITLTRLAPYSIGGSKGLPTPSSSNIRQALSEGDIATAQALLGRPYSLSGTISHGQGIGTKLGFPTANLAVSPEVMMPKSGVYSAIVKGLEDIDYKAVVNIGRRPTVDLSANAPLSIEAHLIGGDSLDLYGKSLTLEFGQRLRDEQRFSSVDELKRAIAADIERVTHPASL
ncbi:MAG: riboflavin biosynthesis protein RibF [Muribaculaceae bacterium]|nr:riboflavin biosynthesis protein RibF [Muribaculaceae bacterium]